MMMKDYYGELATIVYQLSKPIGTALNGDIDYYLERIQANSSKYQRVLEIGSGTGRALIPLLEEGVNIEGIEYSDEMLSLCRDELARRQLTTSLYQGDYITCQFPHSFDTLIIPVATFNLITAHKGIQLFLEKCVSDLKKGGRIIFDIDLPFYPELGERQRSQYEWDSQKSISVEHEITKIDWLTQEIHHLYTYQLWKNQRLIDTQHQQLNIKWYGLTEIRFLLEQAGFKNVVISADYEYELAPSDSNQTITIEATKA